MSYESIVKEEVERAFPENQRVSAYVYGILFMHIIHSDYVVVTKNAITENPLPISDKKFITLLRMVANILERMHADNDVTAEQAQEIVKQIKADILKELE